MILLRGSEVVTVATSQSNVMGTFRSTSTYLPSCSKVQEDDSNHADDVGKVKALY